MKGPGLPTLAANAGSLALLLWLYLGDLLDAARAQQAEVAALTAPPQTGWAWAVLTLALAAAAVAAFGLLRGKGPDFRGYRLLPIVVLVALFVDLFVVTSTRSALGSADRMELALARLGGQANTLAAATGQVPSAEALRPYLAELGDPPYLVHGQPAKGGFSLQTRQGCNGPVSEAPGAPLGTFVYCIAEGQKAAWLTVVALPAAERFGSPALLSRDGKPITLSVQPADLPPPPDAPPPGAAAPK